MNTVRLNAYAKLNLTLDVTGAEGGYHMLDSLVVTVDLCDRIVVRRRKDGLVRVTMHGGPFIAPEHNNAQRAGDAFVSRFSTSGADITVYKNIPVGAGMGGSSADAAGVIAGMGRLYDIDAAALKELADTLGSDTGYLLSGGLARISGRGEKVLSLPFPPPMHFVVALPGEGVSTAACFAEYDKDPVKGSRTEEAARALAAGDLMWAAHYFGNDLMGAARTLCPAVTEGYLALRALSPLGAGMTGSGSASFALFGTPELAAWAKSRYAGTGRAIVLRSVDPAAGRAEEGKKICSDGTGRKIWKNG